MIFSISKGWDIDSICGGGVSIPLGTPASLDLSGCRHDEGEDEDEETEKDTAKEVDEGMLGPS